MWVFFAPDTYNIWFSEVEFPDYVHLLVCIHNLLSGLTYFIKLIDSINFQFSVKFSYSIKCLFLDMFVSLHIICLDEILISCSKHLYKWVILNNNPPIYIIICSNLQETKTFQFLVLMDYWAFLFLYSSVEA